MGKSTVYFTDFRCPVGTSQLDKLKKVCLAAGIKNIDMDGKFVAIKCTSASLEIWHFCVRTMQRQWQICVRHRVAFRF